jgi:broad specificity phosphatase PhoE
MTKVSGWAAYKETLFQEGAMNIPREIQIRAYIHKDHDNDAFLDKVNDSSIITSKIIHFQRHGQGYHNLLGDITRYLGKEFNIDDNDPTVNPFVRADIHDSPLTSKGRQEASMQRSYASKLSPEVIIVSPLHRAIQTALISFSDHLDQGTKFIAHDGCREQLGLLTCNRALPLSQTKIEFPQIDFSLVSHGEKDHLWDRNRHRREHPVEEANRVYEFLTNFIMTRPEHEIAIVCHSAWLFSLCNCVMDCNGNDALESWFGTSEIRSMRVCFHRNESNE